MNVESLRAVLAEWNGLPERDRLNNFLGDDSETGEENEDEDEDERNFGHGRHSFSELNAGVPTDRRLVKIGEVALEVFEDQPQTADVYERPAAATVHGLAGRALS